MGSRNEISIICPSCGAYTNYGYTGEVDDEAMCHYCDHIFGSKALYAFRQKHFDEECKEYNLLARGQGRLLMDDKDFKEQNKKTTKPLKK